MTCVDRDGNVSLTLRVKGKHYEYGIRKVVHLVQEIFMDFPNSAVYFDDMVEHCNLNSDAE